MNREFPSEPERLRAPALVGERRGVVECEVRHVEQPQPGARRGLREARAGVEQRLPGELGAQVGGEIDAAERERAHLRIGVRDFGRGLEPARRLDRADERDPRKVPRVEPRFERRLDLRQDDEVGPYAGGDERIEVAHAGARVDVVDAQAAPLRRREAGAIPGAKVLDQRRAHRVLGRQRDRILEIQDQPVRAGRRGLREAVGPVARREEQRAAERDVVGRCAHA